MVCLYSNSGGKADGPFLLGRANCGISKKTNRANIHPFAMLRHDANMCDRHARGLGVNFVAIKRGVF
jgi:hypothetical protein